MISGGTMKTNSSFINSMQKRSWNPFTKDGLPLTGDAWYAKNKDSNTPEGEPHKVYHLDLKPDSFSRGRSSVTQNFVSKDGVRYCMSAKSTAKLLEGLSDGSVYVVEDGYFRFWAIQVKQGDQLSLESLSSSELEELMDQSLELRERIVESLI
jgi:hypothetical protein